MGLINKLHNRCLSEPTIVAREKIGAIVIEDNYFIGTEFFVLGGTVIGKNSIIADGSDVWGRFQRMKFGGSPIRYIMSMEEYVTKLKKQVLSLPWIENNRYKK